MLIFLPSAQTIHILKATASVVVDTPRASKRNLSRRYKAHVGPLTLAKLFCNKIEGN